MKGNIALIRESIESDELTELVGLAVRNVWNMFGCSKNVWEPFESDDLFSRRTKQLIGSPGKRWPTFCVQIFVCDMRLLDAYSSVFSKILWSYLIAVF